MNAAPAQTCFAIPTVRQRDQDDQIRPRGPSIDQPVGQRRHFADVEALAFHRLPQKAANLGVILNQQQRLGKK